MNFRRFSIKTQLYFSFGTMWAIMLFFAYVRGDQLENVMDRYNAVINSAVIREQYMGNVISELQHLTVDNLFRIYIQTDEYGHFHDMDAPVLSITHHQQRILYYLDAYIEGLLKDQFLSETSRIQHLARVEQGRYLFVNHYIPYVIYLQNALISTDVNDFFTAAGQMFLGNTYRFIDEIWDIRESSVRFTEEARDNMLHYDEVDQQLFMILTIGGMTVAVALAGWLIRNIHRSISELRHVVGQVTAGNRNYDLKNRRNDEFGKLSDDLATMLVSISELDKATMIAEHLNTMVCVVDIDHHLVYVNRGFAREYGIDKNDYESTKFELPLFNEYLKVLKFPETEEEQEDISYFDFTWEPTIQRWVKGTIVAKRWYDGRRVYCYYITDATEAKTLHDQQVAYEQGLREAIHREKEAAAAKNDFIANVSHEIRTPMNSIIGYSELILDDGNLLEKNKNYIKNIVINAEWLLSIIGDIMDFSKMESGKLVLERRPFDLRGVLEHCEQLIMPQVKAKGIDLQFFIDISPEYHLIGDRIRLGQVCINMLSNAVKFTSEGGVTFTVTGKEIGIRRCRMTFEIADTGIGMNPDQMAKILEPFMQADSSTTRKYGGTGLGLPISKRIIDDLDGILEVSSEEGVGSTFKFVIDFDVAEVQPTTEVLEEETEIVRPNFVNKRVLVVEDNEMNQGVILEHLKRVGITPVIVENGKEAVDIMRKHMREMVTKKPFDLVFMDINMPVMDGKEAAMAIKDMGIETPIVAMTANMTTNNRNIYTVYGMEGYITKPFTSQALWRMLLRYFTNMGYNVKGEEEEEKKFLLQMSNDFIKKYRGLYDEMYQEIRQGRIDNAFSLAHNLKSNAGYIKLTELQSVAAKLESKFRSGVVDKDLLTELQIELDKALKLLEANIAEAAQTNVKEKESKQTTISKESLVEIFDELEVLLIENNMNCMMYIEQLELLPEAKWLIHEIEELNFKEALEVLKELRAGL